MVLYLKKKEYLNGYYFNIVKGNNVVALFHVNDLLSLNNFRKYKVEFQCDTLLFKNNIAKKVMELVGFKGIFLSNTAAVYGNNIELLFNLDAIVKDHSKNVFLLLLKVSNYLLLPNEVHYLAKFSFKREILLSNVVFGMKLQLYGFMLYFRKLIYINLIKTCQR